jgi:glycosyltransferase involved in cell wall biosynthesis
MRIVLDLQSAQAESRNRGIGRYSLNLAEAMVRRAHRHEILIALNGAFEDMIEPIREHFRDLVPPQHVRVWSQLKPTADLDEANHWRARASELVRENALCELGADIVHATSLFEGLVDDAVTSVGRLTSELSTAVTLYDLIPFLHAERYLAQPIHKRWYLRKVRSLKAADLLLAISEHSRREAIEALDLDPEFVIAIPGDADARFRRVPLLEEAAKSLLERHQLHKQSIMYTGGIDWRKNVEGLIEAYARLPEHLREVHQLAIVCQISEVDRSRLCSLSQRLGLRHDEVVFTGYISDDDLVGLYNLCKLFVFPSLHEGFGLPVLEAMRCGAPVIGSDRTSIPEVIGRSDALFDPTSIEAISAKLAQALTDDGFRSSLREHGGTQARKFSWDRSAGRALEAFEAVHARRRKRPFIPATRNRPRLAYVSPLPPERSGVAVYSAELLPELAQYYDIELITHLDTVEEPWLDAAFPRRATAWFEAHADRYDRVLYQFGNSPFHCNMFRLLRRFPGSVVLHDFFLSGVMNWMDETGWEAGAFQRALYRSHGWKAVVTFTSDGRHPAMSSYPCNWEIIERAQGILVHSRHSKELAGKWYGPNVGSDWQYVPHLRRIPKEVDRVRVRQELGLPQEAFVVCSFGIIGPTKLNDRLLSAWLNSPPLRDRSDCRLIFVGEGGNDYEGNLARKIKASGCGERIAITGYVVPEEYRHWLAAADVGVQLRAESRGETSGAMLDCLANGLATIVNAHGAMGELPKDAAIFVPDEFADADLAAALERLYADPELRQALGRRAREHVREYHAPGAVARRYAEAIEHFASTHSLASRGRLMAELSSIAEGGAGGPPEVARLAECIAENAAPCGLRQILVDVTRIAEADLKTGGERVSRAVLSDLLDMPPRGYRIEPVYRPQDSNRYHYARSFTGRFLDLGQIKLEDAPVHISPGDIFLALDLDPRISKHGLSFLQYHAHRGLQVIFVVYDLLPVRHRDWFPSEGRLEFEAWLRKSTEIARGYACISRATADDLVDWLATARSGRSLDVGYFHLGADTGTAAGGGVSEETAVTLSLVGARNCFLMVGTLEPCKGHGQALDAIERLWAQGEDIALVIVGKQGWMAEPLVARLRHHPEAGRRLWWFESASDEILEHLYRKASALLMASEGEGFGLPIIEAARHGLRVIARDLAVFREVAGEHAFYFSATDGGELANALQEWLALCRQGEAPSVAGMPILTWAESTRQLLDVILGGNWYRTVTSSSVSNGGQTMSGLVGGEQPPALSITREQRLVAAPP